MELFSESYSLYFRAVEKLLRYANERPLSAQEVQKILSEDTFSESAITMFPKLQSGAWPLLRRKEDGYTSDCILPENFPLTILQRAWIKSLLKDPRIHLFLDDDEIESLQSAFSDIDPLYLPQDFYIFDKSSGSDDYKSPEYRHCFRLLLQAIHENAALSIQYEGGKENRLSGLFLPYKLEYSAKDDKFRAYCYRKAGKKMASYILNVSRIVSIEPVDRSAQKKYCNQTGTSKAQFRQVILEITKERNAIERCMVHFAHFEKRTEYDEAADKYTCIIRYNASDETEIVIRVLSFGPTIKVIGPDKFVDEIRRRVKRQANLIHKNIENSLSNCEISDAGVLRLPAE